MMMDAASIKIVFLIFYFTVLVVVACVWFRLVNTPHGETYRRIRKQGGYKPLAPNDIVEDDDQAQGGVKPNSST
jgi:hypothetical protein